MGLKKDIIELTNCTRIEYEKMAKMPLVLMADNVRSMQNIGAMLRTCDALLVQEMVMAGISPVPPAPEISKTALGAEESVHWRHVADAFREAEAFKQSGGKVCVLEQAHGSVMLNLFKADPSQKYMLVVGNEVAGVDQRIVDIADVVIEIPMNGIKHSLNVSVSTGMAIWKFYESFFP